jgi:hypothetical protein
MYILSKHFETPPEQDIFCPLTGESYVYMEGNDLSLIDPKYHDGALEVLPKRFFQQAMIVRRGDGSISVSVRKPD